ncbi:MAG: type II toxin-antitoxin system VapC family toxin [Gemmatimonadetes bacterium]|nr:type II toxin-antitoxin system VapC family toxin [Gemmatimonadota bacterium]
MIFVDANVFMYAVGRDHPLAEASRSFFKRSLEKGAPLVTSAEVLQEILHAYLPVDRLADFDAAVALATARTTEVWPVEAEDVILARDLAERHSALSARDLLHRACCLRRDVGVVETYDRALAAAFDG